MEKPSHLRPESPEPESTKIEFDFDFRPDYWAPDNPVAIIVGNIVGELRRRVIELSLRMGESSSLGLGPEDLDDFLSEERRMRLGSLHPCLTGGENLPPYLPGEVEIGRFVLNTPTLDVISIRARKEGDELDYRVVDEKGGENFSFPPTTSERPLSFGEVVGLVDSIQVQGDWIAETFVEQVLEYNIEGGVGADSLPEFLKAESHHYPQLGPYFDLRAQEWLEEYHKTRGESNPW
jgi:hypothetical protein